MRIGIDEHYPQSGVEIQEVNGGLTITMYADVQRTPGPEEGQTIVTANVVRFTMPKGSVEEADVVAHFQYYFDKALADELAKAKEVAIAPVKKLLDGTDYMGHKVVDGVMTEQEYEPEKQLREVWRETINAMESAATIEELNAITYPTKAEQL